MSTENINVSVEQKAPDSSTPSQIHCDSCEKLETQVNLLVDNVEQIVGKEGLSPLNIINVCISLMKIVEKLPNTTGLQRKNLVLQGITRHAKNKGYDSAILLMLPSFIDAAIAIENGDTQIAVTDVAVGCCLGLSSACNNKNQRK
jgi:hypothetical protein